jgi:hypothetical protein
MFLGEPLAMIQWLFLEGERYGYVKQVLKKLIEKYSLE